MLLLHGENKTDRETVSSCHSPRANVLRSRDAVGVGQFPGVAPFLQELATVPG